MFRIETSYLIFPMMSIKYPYLSHLIDVSLREPLRPTKMGMGLSTGIYWQQCLINGGCWSNLFAGDLPVDWLVQLDRCEMYPGFCPGS